MLYFPFLTSECQWGSLFLAQKRAAEQPSLYSVPLWPCPDPYRCLQILRLEPCMQQVELISNRCVCCLPHRGLCSPWLPGSGTNFPTRVILQHPECSSVGARQPSQPTVKTDWNSRLGGGSLMPVGLQGRPRTFRVQNPGLCRPFLYTQMS